MDLSLYIVSSLICWFCGRISVLYPVLIWTSRPPDSDHLSCLAFLSSRRNVSAKL
ncbi:hypothetical protein BDZ94DRAFT_1247459 [Collybia nuda]|uniref:Uncharacterized protein n=1 Tax=Collybia nuda TaxID=64659 RepID=A0A9P6CQ22_9AGAR|nr:hypothetical protein BDZ94DRAFT_1247459 [Collybia nuda]